MKERAISMLKVLHENGYTLADLAEVLSVDSNSLQELQMKNEFQSNEQRLKQILKELCIQPNLSGYKYIKIGILLALADPNLIYSGMLRLYQQIASIEHSNASNVERSIRNAIGKAFNSVDKHVQAKYLGMHLAEYKPTNSEFLYAVIEYLQDN